MLEGNCDTVYWIFSTIPQVIAAMAGLSVTGITIAFGNLDHTKVNQDGSLDEVIKQTKCNMLKMLLWLLGISILAITVDIAVLYNAQSIAETISVAGSKGAFCENWWCTMVTIINISPFAMLFMALMKFLSPGYQASVINRLSSEINQEESRTSDELVSSKTFIEKFFEFESVARQLIPKPAGMPFMSIRQIVNLLMERDLISFYEKQHINECIRIRNLIVHGGDIKSVSRKQFELLANVTNALQRHAKESQSKNE